MSARRSYHYPSPALRCAEAGLAELLVAIDRPLRPQTVVLTFSHVGAAHVCLVIDRTPRTLDELTGNIVRAVRRLPQAATALIATTCLGDSPDNPLVATADEHIAFLEARELFDLESVDLVDWFLIGQHRSQSLAEATAAQSRWLLAGPPA
jgi:hypothetical protein